MGIMQVKLIYNRLQFNLTVLLYIVTLWCKKTGFLNVTQGSYKLQVRSPAGSHLSKLVATPGSLSPLHYESKQPVLSSQ